MSSQWSLIIFFLFCITFFPFINIFTCWKVALFVAKIIFQTIIIFHFLSLFSPIFVNSFFLIFNPENKWIIFAIVKEENSDIFKFYLILITLKNSTCLQSIHIKSFNKLQVMIIIFLLVFIRIMINIYLAKKKRKKERKRKRNHFFSSSSIIIFNGIFHQSTSSSFVT